MSIIFFAIPSGADVNYITKDGQILAAQGECSQIKSIQKDLRYFSTEISGTSNCNTIIQNPNNECTLQLRECLPNHMSQLLGTSPTVPGPNCYGTSLYATRNYQYLRFVSEKEFHNWVEFGYCISSATPEPGDIGAFQSPSVYVHAFTYLTENLVYEKNRYDAKNTKYPIMLNSFYNTLFKWEADEYCKKYGGGSKECYNKLHYYKCDTESFFINLSSVIKNPLEQLEKLTHKIVQSPNEADKILAHELLQDLESKLLSPHLSESNFRILREMLNSIDDQLDSAQRHLTYQ